MTAHRRGYRGRRYRPRRRATPAEPQLQARRAGLSIQQSRQEKLQSQMAAAAVAAERARLDREAEWEARLVERDAAAPMLSGSAVWREHRTGTTTGGD